MARYVDVPGMSTRVRVPEVGEIPQMSDDGYPAVIADQRHGYAVETREEVESYWLDWMDSHDREPRFDAMLSTVPYINCARWIADCPACKAKNWAWDRNPLVACLECGLIVKAAWVAPTIRAAAIRLLAVRPIPNCNWNAHQGETVEWLAFENLMLLDEPSVEKNGLVVPLGLDVPEALERYIDPKVT